MNTKTKTMNTNGAVTAAAKTIAGIDTIPETISAPMSRCAAAEGSASRALDAQFEALRSHYAKAGITIGKSVKTCQYRRGVATALDALQPLTGWSGATCRQYSSAFFGCLAANLPFDRNFRTDSSGGKTTDETLLRQYLRKALKKAQDLSHPKSGDLIKTAKLFGVTLD